MRHHMRGRLARSASLLSILATASMAAPAAQAQDNGARDGGGTFLGTIVLQGEKVLRDLMKTASSVSVATGEDIEAKAGKDEIRTVIAVIAGMANVVYADNVSTPIIRGQNSEGPHTGANAFFAGAVPRATINLDGHYLSYNEFYFGATSAWDLDTVEVYRGPQTTSQGANAITGAIVVNTKDPSFTPEGAWRLEGGDYGQRRASIMWSGPIAKDLAVRVALDYSGRDTFIDYIGTTFRQNEIGQDFSALNARLKLLWVPSDIDGLEVKLTWSHTDSTRPSAEGASPVYADLNSITMYMPGWGQITDTAVLDVTYDTGSGIVLSNKLQFTTSDVDRRLGVATAGDADVQQDNWSNEAKLAFGTAEDPLSGFVGLYAAYTDQDEMLNQGGISTFHDQKHNLGVYGELSWRIDEQWTLTGGLRYQRDHITRVGDVSPLFASSDLDYDRTFEEVLPKIVLAYAPSDDLTLGAMVSRGYNPGGVSLDFTSSRAWDRFEAETVWNYELFARAELLDDRLALTGNLFYMDYENAQYSISQVVGGVTHLFTSNAEAAESYGLELGADYSATDALTLRGSLGLLHTEFTRFDNMPAFEGNEFARAPGKMLSLGASWDVNGRLNLGGQIRYVDGYYSNTANTPAYAIDGYTLVDVTATYKLNDSLELYGYVNNLFDERTPVLLEPARGDVVFIQGSMTSPRMVGIGLRGTF